jgi:cytoskeletal protein CcmA (bactofilin family)
MRTTPSLLTVLILMTGATYTQAQTPTTQAPLVFADTYVTGGASAEFGGDIVANTYLTVGDSAIVAGNIWTGTATNIGAFGVVRSNTGNGVSNIHAGTAATMGASARVDGNVNYGTALAMGAGAQIGSDTNYAAQPMAFTSGQVNDAQNYYNGLTAFEETYRNYLATTIPQDLTLDPYHDANFNLLNPNTVVYNAASLTTTAGITITLKGGYNWVFNITDMLSFGAGTKIVMPDGGSVIWNSGSYATIGAHAEMVGTILAGGYVTTGAYSTVTGSEAPSLTKGLLGDPDASYCGGIFSAASYVTIGAGATVSGCAQGHSEPPPPPPPPPPLFDPATTPA